MSAAAEAPFDETQLPNYKSVQNTSQHPHAINTNMYLRATVDSAFVQWLCGTDSAPVALVAAELATITCSEARSNLILARRRELDAFVDNELEPQFREFCEKLKHPVTQFSTGVDVILEESGELNFPGEAGPASDNENSALRQIHDSDDEEEIGEAIESADSITNDPLVEETDTPSSCEEEEEPLQLMEDVKQDLDEVETEPQVVKMILQKRSHEFPDTETGTILVSVSVPPEGFIDSRHVPIPAEGDLKDRPLATNIMGTPALSELISGFHPAPVIYPPSQSRMDARKDSGVELDTVPKSISDFQFYFPMGNPSLMARAGQYTRTREAVKMLLRKSASSCSLFPSVDEETDDLEGAICHRDDLPDGKVWPERKPLEVALAELKDCFSLSRKDVSDGTRPSALFRHQFWSVMDALGLPRYCSHVLFDKLIAVKNGNANGRSAAVTSLGAEPVSTETDKGRIADEFLEFEDIERWWKDLSTVYHDDHAIIFKIMQKTSNQQYLTPLDFHTVVDEVVKRHPGLEFLSSLAVFQARYVETVITRIFFTKLHTYSERMTLAEFRKHSFLDLLIKLQIDDDINATRDVFSYKHFYVIYCKFWELDSDHNMIIEADDLYQYSQRALTTIMMDRVIAGYGKPLSAGNKSRQFSYKDFIWFMLCIEDKKRDASVDYWFRCLDLDSDGKLSLHELHEFYKQQVERMIECRMSEPWKFDDFVCSLLDLIKPKNSTYITPRDLKNSQNAALFFDMIFDLRKYDRYIRRIDPTFRDMDDVVVENRDGTRLKLDGWDKFAERSYELLAYEESSNATYQPEGMGDEDLSDEEDGHWTSREDGALGLSGWAADETAIRDESDEEDGSGHFVRGHRTSQRYGSSDEEDEEEEDMVEEVVEQIELVSTTSSSRNAGRARSKAQAKALI